MREKLNARRLVALLVGALLCLAALAFALAFSLRAQPAGGSRPEKGVLDLLNWRPGRDNILSLNGEWGFYWQRFMADQALARGATPDAYADVPSVWNRYEVNGERLPGFGYGTYALRVINAPQGQPLALRVPTFSTAYALYIDGKLLSSNGTVGTDKERSVPGYLPRVVAFTPDRPTFTLIFHVSNFTYARGGMWYAVSMGTADQIRRMDLGIADKDAMLFGALMVMALYYLVIFLLRREDKSNLFYAFMCLVFAARTAIYGGFLVYRLLPGIGFRAIVVTDYITLCWFSILASFMAGQLFPEEADRRVLAGLAVYGGAMTALYLLTPIALFTRLVYLTQAGAVAAGLYAIYCATKAFLCAHKDAAVVLLGMLPVIAAALHDMLYQNNVILSDMGELVPVGLFVLLLMQSFVLARRSAEAFGSVSLLSQKLLKLDKIKDEFLANTSHELRTPLSGILGITEAMLKGGDGELSGRQRQNLTIIAGSSRRLANLVNDILDYSKMKNGDIPLYIRPIRIEGPIRAVVGVFRQLSLSNAYEVAVSLPDGLPPVKADENRVVQILYNLVGNAAKFTAQGRIEVSARRRGGVLEVCVSDTGEGIPEHRQQDIFKSFEQLDTSLTRRHGGTGLGLAITKRLVELMDGSIWVESRPGAGSRFYFTLPVAEGAAPPPPADEERAEAYAAATLEQPPAMAEAPDGSARILLVDDDAVNLQAASSILRLDGYGVTTAGSGKAALAALAGRRDFSVVILDVMMPEMSGYEVCRKIRAHRPGYELPVLMLTAKASTEDVVAGLEAGANDYLAKPYEAEELLARVRTLVALKASVDKAMAAETALMQAQIKPHFLFNTLNAISSFCDSDPARAQRLIDDFSGYLRKSFDFKNLETCCTLEQEMGFVQSYVNIQKARFGEGLSVGIDIGDMAGILLPVLSIQPLVENAITHGLRKRGGGGSVRVSVRRSAEGIEVAVEDDGQGIPEQTLATLLTPAAGRGLGLWNIDRRLKKFYGRGLTIESAPGQGTRVSYIIPPGGEAR